MFTWKTQGYTLKYGMYFEKKEPYFAFEKMFLF